MILELLLGNWAINSIRKDIDECIEAFETEQDEMQKQIDYSKEELAKAKNKSYL